MRSCSIEVITETHVGDEFGLPLENVPEGWLEVFQELGRPIRQFVVCEFDVAEEVIGWILCDNGYSDVRVVEALRPTQMIYKGPLPRTAEILFWEEVTKRVRELL